MRSTWPDFEEAPVDLRIGTFNIWGLPEPFTKDLSARLRALAARLSRVDLDVLLIQEAWTDEARDPLREGALRAGFHVAEAAEAPGGGLMVLSRTPIRSSLFERFHFRGDPERVTKGEFLAGKGFQTVVLERPADSPLVLINTHLHARYRSARARLNSAVRAAQLLQLVGALHRLEHTAIIGGDLNCRPTDPEYRIFTRLAGATEVAEASQSPATISRTNFYKRHRGDPDKRVDYLFVRTVGNDPWNARESSLLFQQPVSINGRLRSLSDHFGFRSTIRFDARTIAAGNERVAQADSRDFDLAERLLALGRQEADRRERLHLRHAGSWIAGAALAAGLRRHPRIGRRRFLRGAAGAVATLSLAPGLGYTSLARFDSDHKRDAFDEAREVLEELRPAARRPV